MFKPAVFFFYLSLVRNLMFIGCCWMTMKYLLFLFYFTEIISLVFPFVWFYTSHFWTLYSLLFCAEDRTLTYNGLLLQIVPWMETCLIGTHTTSSHIYDIINATKNKSQENKRKMTFTHKFILLKSMADRSNLPSKLLRKQK